MIDETNMKTYISLLRGINISGQKKIKMVDLKAMYESLGYSGVQTYIQSGNVIFECPQQETKKLIAVIEQAIKRDFGYDVSVMIRTPEQFESIITNNPFSHETGFDMSALYVCLFTECADKKLLTQLDPGTDKERVHVKGQEAYIYCPIGYGNTRFNNNYLEKKLQQAATTRNWKTMNALLMLAKEN